jgi:hypothetical protein
MRQVYPLSHSFARGFEKDTPATGSSNSGPAFIMLVDICVRYPRGGKVKDPAGKLQQQLEIIAKWRQCEKGQDRGNATAKTSIRSGFAGNWASDRLF